jgi:hypothetical protein
LFFPGSNPRGGRGGDLPEEVQFPVVPLRTSSAFLYFFEEVHHSEEVPKEYTKGNTKEYTDSLILLMKRYTYTKKYT